MVEVQLGSKYVSFMNYQMPPIFDNSGILIYLGTINVLCSHKKLEILKSFIKLILLLSFSKYTEHFM